MTTKIPLIVILNNQTAKDNLEKIIDDKNLPVLPVYHCLSKSGQKPSQKHFKAKVVEFGSTALLLDNERVYLVGQQNGQLIKTNLNWQALARRIVTAGRKNELLLKACKLFAGMSVIDGTAGFGYDGLILASTGANVHLIEKNPIMALLLFYEYEMMKCHNHWHKLLGRITVSYDNFLEITTDKKSDVVYLDPMFPNESFNAKVGKHMQLLHTLAIPPTTKDEKELLNKALWLGNKAVIKRPISAPYLANQAPIMSLNNDAIRFDVYEGK